ncbi:MAG: hypothetical protein R3E46_17680 [Sedimenticolaceae bacterium]
MDPGLAVEGDDYEERAVADRHCRPPLRTWAVADVTLGLLAVPGQGVDRAVPAPGFGGDLEYWLPGAVEGHRRSQWLPRRGWAGRFGGQPDNVSMAHN